ncbi:hypothetical protein HPP92_003909 [Vanilla planifolia]|uniref:Uncharacterized protein n=1 Tax=Vanilla planifolia TaxID=51239 RepID=A0A835SHB4_VANPL|nr:hypothetical protein HPP92_003909 [Vanilla planifolia]
MKVCFNKSHRKEGASRVEKTEQSSVEKDLAGIWRKILILFLVAITKWMNWARNECEGAKIAEMLAHAVGLGWGCGSGFDYQSSCRHEQVSMLM